MRLAWQADAGLPPAADATCRCSTSGRFVGTPDLLDPVPGVYGMYDGALHLGGRRASRDVAKEAAYRRARARGRRR